ncbi:MAG: hypothetical protein A3K22_05725 [Deltaproteobacteria bacterium RBG_16_42_7]|nr:MAG: hypothetical protein A3K22_05725 [Deltaproteobacteria bacterium RBG_16_42_7]
MAEIERENIDVILKGINSAVKGKKLYPAGHPAIAAPITKAYQTLSELLKTNNKIFVGITKDVMVFEETPLMDAEKTLGELLHQMKRREIEGIIFEKGLMQEEFFSFIDSLSGETILKGKELQTMLASRNISHITIKSISKRSIFETYTDAISVVQETMNQIRLGKVPQAGEIVRVSDELTELVLTDQNAMLGLTMIKNYDNYLFNHSVNVSILSIALAESMKQEEANLRIVGVGGLLHDLGKTGVAEEIIKKPDRLSTEEFESIKQHPVLGSRMIEQMPGLAGLISRVVYEHHIRYDHSGYPHTESPLHPLSMIITIVDAYDAMTTLRVYQRPFNPVEAIKLMNTMSGKHFDPNTLKAFIAMIGFYPVGTTVRLTTNDIGIVTKANPTDSLSPTVKIIFGGDGKQINKPYELDLLKEGNRNIKIIAPVDPLTKGMDLGHFFEEESKEIIPE